MKNSMNHVADSIPAWLAGELDPAVVEHLERHLEQCPDCARAARESRAIWTALGSATNNDSRSSSPSVWPQVRARTLGRRNQESWFYGPNALVRAGLATAAMAAGLVFAVLLPGGGLDPSPDAGDQQVENLWLDDSSWTIPGQDDALDRMWLSAGLDTEG